jgi:flagellar motor switch protein FliN/FliY
MRSAVDFDKEAGLKTFCNIIIDTMNANLASIIGRSADVSMKEAATGAPADILSGYEGGTIISATEGKTGFEVGLIFNTKDITIIADLMLMGDGEPKAELDADLKDAVMEFANQFFGALVVPIDTQIGKKVEFSVENAEKLSNTNVFQANAYVAVDLQGNLKDAPFSFRLYVDEAFGALLNSKGSSPEPAATAGPDFFSMPAGMPSAPAASGLHGQNMDMLMDIEIPISVRMGSSRLFLKHILGLGPGNIVELDQNANEPVELAVNDKAIARGEVVIVDGYFGFRIKEIISKAERLKRLKD